MNANENTAVLNFDGDNEPKNSSKLYGPFIFEDDTLPQDNDDRLNDDKIAQLMAELDEYKENVNIQGGSLAIGGYPAHIGALVFEIGVDRIHQNWKHRQSSHAASLLD